MTDKNEKPEQAADDPDARAAECGVELSKVLRKFRCTIEPMLMIESIGGGMSKAVAEATYRIRAIPREGE